MKLGLKEIALGELDPNQEKTSYFESLCCFAEERKFYDYILDSPISDDKVLQHLECNFYTYVIYEDFDIYQKWIGYFLLYNEKEYRKWLYYTYLCSKHIMNTLRLQYQENLSVLKKLIKLDNVYLNQSFSNITNVQQFYSWLLEIYQQFQLNDLSILTQYLEWINQPMNASSYETEIGIDRTYSINDININFEDLLSQINNDIRQKIMIPKSIGNPFLMNLVENNVSYTKLKRKVS